MNALDRRIFAAYNSFDSTPLPDLLIQLLENQKRTWPMAAEGYSSLQYVQIRELKCNSSTGAAYPAWLQFNPKRITSTGAKVDADSISRRRCFLCIDNLPPEQQGVLYERDFIALCNPMPIFSAHYTISHVQHQPQIIEPNLEIFLRLARDLSPRFTVFYNGAKCGASAPDHFHFQAVPAGKIPIEQEAIKDSRREHMQSRNGIAILLLKDLGRAVIVLEGKQAESIATILRQQLMKMKAILDTSEEPMVNIICHYHEPQWRVIVFPRRRHRPEVFFKTGADKILISPAAVDMGGLIITPIEKDFQKVDARMIEQIYREVSWEEESVRSLLLS
ncbi:MAG: DUF4922 domain-containing protein [candidate division KSB1 bacterium]|nr:DUF4922 domain-containing protein [candidate division KSB1 bacterium]MDZ7301759.1 DUF4922 domain-containing protein [candidate division KSB1 bacterium]MDZ7311462.1 DUF4922 domain-containing protein [candidate division KSB1 bacterium]